MFKLLACSGFLACSLKNYVFHVGTTLRSCASRGLTFSEVVESWLLMVVDAMALVRAFSMGNLPKFFSVRKSKRPKSISDVVSLDGFF